MYDSLDYDNHYSKTSGSLWQSHKDEVVLDNNGNAFDFTVNNTTNFFKYKTKTTGKTGS